MFKGPDIQKTAGLGASGKTDDNVDGIVFGGILPTSGTYAALGTSVELLSADDADDLGFNSAYDSTNKVLVRYHIDQYFKYNPNGKLWIMVVAQTVTLTQMCTLASAYVTKLINDSGKTVRNVGVVRNPASGYTSTITNGIDGDVLTAVAAAQLLADGFVSSNVYIDGIWIEGREVSGSISSIKDLRTMTAAVARVVIAQDSDVAALDAMFAKTAAVGAAMGMNGIRRVEEDLGSLNVKDNPDKSLDSYPLNDGLSWEKPAISSGTLVSALTAAEIQVLQDNGFIFADSWPSYPGVYFNKGSACTDDADDFAYVSRLRTWNYLARLALGKLIPRYNSTIATVDGKMTTIEISDWQQDINNNRDGLGRAVVDGHAVSATVFLDPDQIIDANEGEVVVQMTAGVFNYVRKITGQLKMTV